MTYHLHTENCPNIGEIASRYFPGFTLTFGNGYWQGHIEPTAILEVTTDDVAKVLALASEIRSVNRQTAVLVESMPSTHRLCSADDCSPDPLAWTERSYVQPTNAIDLPEVR